MKINNPRISTPDLSSDIVDNILLKSHAESVCRFRCVCKRWNELLKSPDFMNNHLKHSLETEKLNCLCIEDNHEFRMHITKSSSLYTMFENKYCGYVKIDSPLEDPSIKIQIVGSHNGLMLMKEYGGKHFWLWNPYTKEFKEIFIPEAYGPEGHRSWVCSVTYGVDYNCHTGDYNIVVASGYAYDGNVDYGSRIQVYTSDSNSWKTFPRLFPYMCSPLQREVIFVRGAFHWMGMRLPSNTKCIVSFDIHEENFNEVAVAPQILDGYANNAPKKLGILGGCLCIIRSYGGVNIDVWVMKDYNVIESWTKLFTFRIPKHIIPKQLMRIDDVKILWEFKNGEVLFITTKSTYATSTFCCLVLYDPVSQICKATKIWHQPGSYWNIEAYVEPSPVPLKLNSTNENLKLNTQQDQEI